MPCITWKNLFTFHPVTNFCLTVLHFSYSFDNKVINMCHTPQCWLHPIPLSLFFFVNFLLIVGNIDSIIAANTFLHQWLKPLWNIVRFSANARLLGTNMIFSTQASSLQPCRQFLFRKMAAIIQNPQQLWLYICNQSRRIKKACLYGFRL